MKTNKKGVIWMQNQHGYRLKCWVNKRGQTYPTNWKIQAGFLTAPMQNQKREAARA